MHVSLRHVFDNTVRRASKLKKASELLVEVNVATCNNGKLAPEHVLQKLAGTCNYCDISPSEKVSPDVETAALGERLCFLIVGRDDGASQQADRGSDVPFPCPEGPVGGELHPEARRFLRRVVGCGEPRR